MNHKGYAIRLRRQTLNGAPGFWFDAIDPTGRVIGAGWTPGARWAAREQALRDARSVIDTRIASGIYVERGNQS